MRARAVSIGIAAALLLGACSGDDSDEGGDGSTPASSDATATTVAPTTTPSTSSTVAPTTTVELVTEGAAVVVANSSIVGGAAGRMTEELAAAGFTTRKPVNGTDRLTASVVYYTDADGAQAVAESVAAVLGGVDTKPMPDPIPTESGKLGKAQVLVALGTAQADRTLEELAGAGSVETSGSVVVVANAAGVDGAAGEMSAELEFAGFEVGAPTNATVQRARSIVYYGEAEGAQDDAELIAELLGGVKVAPMPDEIPTESGEVDGDVLLVLGTKQAGARLDPTNS
jgi:hypothetical protein